jgi:hypothetical protein
MKILFHVLFHDLFHANLFQEIKREIIDTETFVIYVVHKKGKRCSKIKQKYAKPIN